MMMPPPGMFPPPNMMIPQNLNTNFSQPAPTYEDDDMNSSKKVLQGNNDWRNRGRRNVGGILGDDEDKINFD
jgi:hypothetical protein